MNYLRKVYSEKLKFRSAIVCKSVIFLESLKRVLLQIKLCYVINNQRLFTTEVTSVMLIQPFSRETSRYKTRSFFTNPFFHPF